MKSCVRIIKECCVLLMSVLSASPLAHGLFVSLLLLLCIPGCLQRFHLKQKLLCEGDVLCNCATFCDCSTAHVGYVTGIDPLEQAPLEANVSSARITSSASIFSMVLPDVVFSYA